LANFFFWKPGSILQRSIRGLFRSLLHDTLQACPELIPAVLPDQWDHIYDKPWQVQTDLNIPSDEIRKAFGRLIEYRNLYTKYCFCFFIDGLDEYEETQQDDYKAMIQLLCSWTAAAPEDVKICVSSREYNVFLNAFSPGKKLRLQDLTRRDMERYVHNKLIDMSDVAERTRLVNKVVEKADGIFLWVALVVKTLRERLEEDCPLPVLEKELDSLPQELEALFVHLLNSLSRLSRRKAFETFAIVSKLQTERTPKLTLLTYSFLDDYESNPEFAMHPSFPDPVIYGKALNPRIELGRKRLNGNCKGLVEYREDMMGPWEAIKDKDEPYKDAMVTYTHRSVPEFLEKPSIRADTDMQLKNFNLHDAISQLFLAKIRFLGHRIQKPYLSFSVHYLLVIQSEYGLDCPRYSFRECLAAFSGKFGGEATIPDRTEVQSRICELNNGAYVIGTDDGIVEEVLISSPVVISAFLGHYEYVIWSIENDQVIIDSDLGLDLLFCWAVTAFFVYGRSNSLKVVQFLLRRGVSPQVHINKYFYCPKTISSLISIHNGDATARPLSKEPVSFWHAFALASVLQDSLERDPSYWTVFEESVEIFLIHGADPLLWIEFKDTNNPITSGEPGCSGVTLEITLDKEQRKFLINGSTLSSQFVKFLLGKGGRVSLRDLVDYWKLQDKEKILQLLDRNAEIGRDPSVPATEIIPNPSSEAPLEIELDEQTLKKEDITEPKLTLSNSMQRTTRDPEEVGKAFERRSAPSKSWSQIVSSSHAITFMLGKQSTFVKIT
jgi:hypothetical protein